MEKARPLYLINFIYNISIFAFKLRKRKKRRKKQKKRAER
jgi:hypothetical protein